MIGQTISHYRIIAKLGEGGMGVVYKAEDTKLGRAVALKFLPPELTRDAASKERFVQEARAASALDHPNICTIHEVAETNDNRTFIAMAYYEGETLKDRIERGPLKLDEAIDIAAQVAQGLAKAHGQGIVHRDIKPANIIVTNDGLVKIVDFGLAKLAGTKLTKTGATLGTAQYMSPEQARGEQVDHRTDIWSLGAVLYEMLTGKHAFPGEYEQSTLYAIMNEEPEPVTALRSGVPMELERIVRKALAKKPSERYQHVEDMVVDLRALHSTTKAHRTPQRARRIGRRGITAIALGAVVISVAVIVAIRSGTFAPRSLTGGAHDADARKMIVVLPFENLGPSDDEYFASGTTDAITAHLATVGRLGVISRQDAMQYKKSTKSVRQIGKELGVDYILEGTVQRERPGDPASRVRVIPQLIRVSDNTHVWAETYDDNMSEVFRVQSAIAERVATQLDIALRDSERRIIERRPTENSAAYECYLLGRNYSEGKSVSNLDEAVRLYKKAVSLDPRFAEAWAALSGAYQFLYWVYDRPGALALGTEAAERAAQLAPDLPEAQIQLGAIHYHKREYSEALKHQHAAYRLRPDERASLAIGMVLRRLGKYQEALDQFEEARRLNPLSSFIYYDALGYTNLHIRRFDEAERNIDQAISLDPSATVAYVEKAFICLARDGDLDAAGQAMSEMSRRANIEEEAERVASSGITFSSDLRFHQEIYKRAFDTFETGPMGRYRTVQPAVIAAIHLYRALLVEAEEGRQEASARYDSARIYYERLIARNPQSAQLWKYHIHLGLAYAGLGRTKEAILEGEEAIRIMPASKDAFVADELPALLAEIYMRCGEHEKAIDELETVLSHPGYTTATLLRIDPLWEPIRDNPRFRRLLEKN